MDTLLIDRSANCKLYAHSRQSCLRMTTKTIHVCTYYHRKVHVVLYVLIRFIRFPFLLILPMFEWLQYRCVGNHCGDKAHTQGSRQRQTAVTAHLKSEQLQLCAFARQKGRSTLAIKCNLAPTYTQHPINDA